jgi:hypothetical protein
MRQIGNIVCMGLMLAFVAAVPASAQNQSSPSGQSGGTTVTGPEIRSTETDPTGSVGGSRFGNNPAQDATAPGGKDDPRCKEVLAGQKSNDKELVEACGEANE